MTEPAYLGFLADDSLPDWIGLVALAKLIAPEIPDGSTTYVYGDEPDPPAFQIVAKLRADILGGTLKAELRKFHAYGDPDEKLVTEWFIHRGDARQYFKAPRWEPPKQTPLWNWLYGDAATPERADNVEPDPRHRKTTNAEQDPARQILPRKPRKRVRDAWTEVISATIDAFEAEHGFSPTAREAWTRLVNTHPDGWSYDYRQDRNDCLMAGEKLPLDQATFEQRFRRLFQATRSR